MPNPFSPANTAKAIHDSLAKAEAAIPNGHTKALILDGTYTTEDGPGVRAVYVQRTGSHWRIMAEGAYNGNDGPSAGVAVAWSGK